MTHSIRTASRVALLGLSLGVAACNLVHVGGLGGGGAKGGGEGSNAATNDKAADPAMVKLFQSLDYKCCATGRERGRNVLATAGIDVTQIGHFGTPDAEWLPGWNNRGSHDELADAFLQGAINKTWSAQCIADWEDYSGKAKKLDDALRPTLGALSSAGYYERASGLRALFGKVLEQRKGLGIELSAEHPMSHTGLLFDVALATYQLHREQHREFAATSVLGAYEKELQLLHERGRHASKDAVFERDLFCAMGERLGTHRTAKMPNLGPLDADAQAVPKWPEWDQASRIDAINKEVASKPPHAYIEMPRVDMKVPWLLGGGWGSPPTFDPKAPKLGRVGPLEIVAIKGSGATAVVVLGDKKISARGYDCRPTGRPGNDFGGQEVACKTGTDEDVVEISVQIGELPAGVTLAKGDKLELYLDVESDKSVVEKNTAPLVVRKRTIVGTARHLASVQRGAQVLAKY